MRVFLAGASGAIGRPLTGALLAAGHTVTAMTRSPHTAAGLEQLGASAVVADAFDEPAVRTAIAAAEPDVLIHQLTAFPNRGGARAFAKGLEQTSRLRRETVPLMIDAAAEAGATRAVVQSIAFITRPDGSPVHDENAPLWTDAPDRTLAGPARAVADMERSVLDGPLEGIVLRYGFFYGPGTAWAPDGQFGAMIRRRLYPIIGDGQGRMSFVHVSDAVTATVLAAEGGAPGVYNVCEPDPRPAAESITAAAEAAGAKPPRRIGTRVARLLPASLRHYGTTLPGNDSSKAREVLGWAPAHRWPPGA